MKNPKHTGIKVSKKLTDYNWDCLSSGEIPNHQGTVRQVKELLNTTGPGFCLAKFRQMTLHLGTGTVHSCHHPHAHKIPLNENVNDPNILFNTQKLKDARKEMLSGGRPGECDFCWRVEDNDTKNIHIISDRHLKSSEPWALQYHDEISEYTGDETIFPSYLEVDFGNACNLRCTYCGPEYSSKWVEHLKQTGPIKLLENTKHVQWAQGWQDLDNLVFKNRECNPYIDLFWEWFPEAYKHLKHYRITGGEPLMSKETFRSIDWFINNPNRELDFSINSNLSVPDKLWDKFIDKIIQLRDSDSVNRITIYTSVEGWGERAEYGRVGLDFELFKKRFEQVAALGDIRIVIMSTYNIFSITSFGVLLEWVRKLKSKYNPNNHVDFIERETNFILPDTGESFVGRQTGINKHSYIVGIDIPYLRNPAFLDARICTNDIVNEYWISSMNYLAANTTSNSWNNHQGFEQHEYEKFYRNLVHRMYYNKNGSDFEYSDYKTKVNRAKFYAFVGEKDRRDGTDFLTTFPEMTAFYEVCKHNYEEILAEGVNEEDGISE